MAKKKAKKETKLTKIQEKRVAILKDAIAQVKAEKYEVQAGMGYVDEGTGNLPDFYEATQLCELFTGKQAKDVELNKYLDNVITKENPCQVCAKGALLLSSIRKFNNFSLQDAADTSLNTLAGEDGGTYEIFGEENADKMEEYFECNDPELDIDGNEVDYYDENRNHQWSDSYLDDTDRIIAIFTNAIANKGTFKP